MLRKMMVLSVGSIAVLTALLLVSANQPVQAVPMNEVEILWVDEDGNPVGSYLKLCNGESDIDGTVSDWRIKRVEPCQSGNSGGGCYFRNIGEPCDRPPYYQACVDLFGAGWCNFIGG